MDKHYSIIRDIFQLDKITTRYDTQETFLREILEVSAS